jgi:hypothetical protein
MHSPRRLADNESSQSAKAGRGWIYPELRIVVPNLLKSPGLTACNDSGHEGFAAIVVSRYAPT